MPEDYLMRQIQNFAHALARIMGLAKLRQYNEAIEVISQTTTQILRLDLDTIMAQSNTSLVDFLDTRYPPNEAEPLRRELVTLLREAGAIHAARGSTNHAWESYLKALDLLVQPSAGTTVARLLLDRPLVEQLLGVLDGNDMPTSTGLLVMEYFERSNDFAQAEDALFRLLEAKPATAEVISAGLAFYDRLGALSDAELAAGNLPREELAAGRRELLSA